MVRIFTTDGSCSRNPGPGGYAACEWRTRHIAGYVKNQHGNSEFQEWDELWLVWVKHETFENTTNNRMELQAILEVMKVAEADTSNAEYLVYSDSAYAINMIKPGGWIEGWARNGWINSKNKTVENLDIVKEIYKYRIKIFDKFQLVKVRGHAGDVKNEITDAIASRNKKKLEKFILENNIKINNKYLIFNKKYDIIKCKM